MGERLNSWDCGSKFFTLHSSLFTYNYEALGKEL